MFHEVAAAGLSGCGPGTASAKNRGPHDPSLAEHRLDDKGDAVTWPDGCVLRLKGSPFECG